MFSTDSHDSGCFGKLVDVFNLSTIKKVIQYYLYLYSIHCYHCSIAGSVAYYTKKMVDVELKKYFVPCVLGFAKLILGSILVVD